MMLAASTISLLDGFLELCGKLSGYVRFQAGDFLQNVTVAVLEGGGGFICIKVIVRTNIF